MLLQILHIFPYITPSINITHRLKPPDILLLHEMCLSKLITSDEIMKSVNMFM